MITTTLGATAELILNIYDNGHVTSSDEKLDNQDILQLTYTTFGEVAIIEYYKQLQGGNAEYFFSGMIKSVDLNLKKKGNRAPCVELDNYINLPNLAGVLRVYPFSEDYTDPQDDYERMKPGKHALYTSRKLLDDTGLRFYIPKGKSLELWGGDSEGKITIEYLQLDQKTEIPGSLANVTIREVLKVIMPGRQLPVDLVEDGDPNTISYKQRLDQPTQIN